MRSVPLSILFISAVSVLLYLGYASYTQERTHVMLSQRLCKAKEADALVAQKLQKWLEHLSMGAYGAYSAKKDRQKLWHEEASVAHKNAMRLMGYFFALIMIAALLFWIADRDMMILLLGVGSLLSLGFGLISPLLTTVVYKALPVIGEATLSFESKSVVGTIHTLFSQHNIILALVVLLFSVVVPLIKSGLIILYGALRERGGSRTLVHWIEKIGKWSMMDVFVVALLVVFFSTKQDIHTALMVQTGLYFFVGYVLLSMVGSGLLLGPHRG